MPMTTSLTTVPAHHPTLTERAFRTTAVMTLVLTGACGAQMEAPDAADGESNGRPSQTTEGLNADTSPPAEDVDPCMAIADSPKVDLGEANPTTLVRSEQATAAAVDAWLAQRALNGGPHVDLSVYRGLPKDLLPTTPMSVCVFQHQEERPMPGSPGSTTFANGTRVFVVSPDVVVLDAIGEVDRLASQLDTLLPTP